MSTGCRLPGVLCALFFLSASPSFGAVTDDPITRIFYDESGAGGDDIAIKNLRFGSRAPFVNIVAGLTGVQYASVAWGDYDNDGDLDILLTGWDSGANKIAKVYQNTGGTFTDIGAGLTGVAFTSVAWGDYDNDGDLDILLTGQDSTNSRIAKVYQNSGGTFTDIVAGLTGVNLSSVAWGDYDNDGDLDILLTGSDVGSNAIAKVYQNTGGTFTDIGAGLTGVYRSSVAWGDYDNDGDLDILLTGWDSGANEIAKVYQNTGGTFTDIGAGLTGVAFTSVAWGDYDNDGDLDILLIGLDSGSNFIAKVYQNTGGTFTDIGAGLTGVAGSPSAVAWGDYDNDGDLDILLTGGNGPGRVAKVYQNTGGTFTDIGAGLTAVSGGSVAWGDYDNDGDLDILLTGSDSTNSTIAKVFQNTIGTPNTPPAPPTNLNAVWSSGTVTFSWDPATDAETPASGLSYNIRAGTTPGGNDVISPHADAATGARRIPATGPLAATSWSYANLPPEFYWSVQAIDAGFAGSPFGVEVNATPDPVIQAVTDIPSDQGGRVRIDVQASGADQAAANAPVSSYTLWRRIDVVPFESTDYVPDFAFEYGSEPGHTTLEQAAFEAARNGIELQVANGRYFHTSSQPKNGIAPPFPPGTWEVVAFSPGIQQPSYLIEALTLADTTEANGIFWSVYLATAHTTTPTIWYRSDPDSGYSVDNIAPGVPANLTLSYSQAEVDLDWDAAPEPDFQFYRVYRDATPGFTPGPGNLIQETATDAWQDATPDPESIYYKVSTVDHAGNESAATSSVVVTSVGGSSNLPIAFSLGANFPNPFRAETSIRFALPKDVHTSIQIFDVAGRLVRTLVNETTPAGFHEVTWNGRNQRGQDVAAGIYLSKIDVDGFRETRRMVFMK